MIFRFGGTPLAYSGRLFFDCFFTFFRLPKNRHKMHPGPPKAAHWIQNGFKMMLKLSTRAYQNRSRDQVS